MLVEIKSAKLEGVQNEDFSELDYNAPLAKQLSELPSETELPVSPNNPPWNGWVAFGVWLLSVLAIILFPVFFIVPYILMNREFSAEFYKTDSTAILLNVLATVPAHLFTLAISWLVATRNGKFSLAETLGLKSGGFRWWYYPLILIIFFAIAAVVNSYIPDGDNEVMKILRSSRSAVYVVAILATFSAPLVEEVVYRGIFYSALQRSIGAGGAIALVTFFFALVHVPQYWGSPGTILLICLLSLVLTLIRWKSDNLLPCIVMHTIFNGLQSIFMIGEPYFPKPETGLQDQAAIILRFFT